MHNICVISGFVVRFKSILPKSKKNNISVINTRSSIEIRQLGEESKVFVHYKFVCTLVCRS